MQSVANPHSHCSKSTAALFSILPSLKNTNCTLVPQHRPQIRIVYSVYDFITRANGVAESHDFIKLGLYVLLDPSLHSFACSLHEKFH